MLSYVAMHWRVTLLFHIMNALHDRLIPRSVLPTRVAIQCQTYGARKLYGSLQSTLKGISQIHGSQFEFFLAEGPYLMLRT